MSRLIELERQDLGEVGRSVVENLATREVKKRVVPHRLEFSSNGEPCLLYENKSVLGRAEYEGMMSMFRLAKKCDYVFWFSPPEGRSEYTEGRLEVGRVISRQNGIKLDCRGIPVLTGGQKMLEMARSIYAEGGVSEGFVDGVEDLREQAIGINLEGEDIWDFCERTLGMEEVWEVIRKGEDVEMTNRVTGLTGEVVEIIRRKLGVIDEDNSVLAGAMFERMMAVRGYQVSAGNHGSLNSLAPGGVFDSVFNEGKRTRIDSMGNKETYCKLCHKWYTEDNCPYCS